MKISSYIFSFLLLCTLNMNAAVYYVSATAGEGGDGSSWETAFRHLQDAIKKTRIDLEDEIWVTAGTYYPDEGAGQIDGDREAHFRVKRTVTLYGGFAGTESSPDQRDLDANVTILSGEISENKAEWSRHVTRVTSGTLDGITITNGNANGEVSPDNEGGAIDAAGTNTARNCHFTGNSAKIGGVAVGGIWTIIDCIFSDNEAEEKGGAISAGTWTITGSLFSGNTAPIGGATSGGVWIVSDTVFSGNTSTTEAGVANLGDWTVTNSVFSGNTSTLGGVSKGGKWAVKNSLFEGNSSTTDGGVAQAGNWTVANSFFVENSADRGGVANQSTWSVSNGVFLKNTASDRGGVARSGTWTVTSSTFLNNAGTVTGGVARGGTWMATNSIFQGSGNNLLPLLFTNSAAYEETPTPDKPRAYNLIDVEWTDGDIGEGFILSGDPLFVAVNDPDGPDDTWGTLDDGLRLDTGSAAIGFGTDSFLFADDLDIDGDEDLAEALPLDAAGVARILNGSLDLGAFEYVEPPFSLVTIVSPGSGGTVSDSGMGGYEENELAIIEATPAAGFAFEGWEGDASGSDNPLELLIDSNKTVTAIFVAEFPLSTTVSPENSGSITESGSGLYKDGAVATVEAVPSAGYIFHQWEGDLTGTDNPDDITIDSAKLITAVFKQQLTLTTAVNPNGTGTVSDSGNGDYLKDDTATVEASPAEGYQFVRWDGDASGSLNPLEITMDTDKSVVAIFAETIIPIYTLTKVVSPAESGTVTDTGDGQYLEGDTASIEAFPAFSYVFDRWEGAATGSANPLEVVMDGDKEITAVFVKNIVPVVTLAKVVDPAESGSITDSGDGLYLQGDTATLEAIPNVGFLFDRWEGGATGTENPIDVDMASSKSVTAIFVENQGASLTLKTIVSADAGIITDSQDGVYFLGDVATVEALPIEGFAFVRWEGDLIGSENPTDLVMDSNKSITAIFAAKKTLITAVTPEGAGTVSDSGDGAYLNGQLASIEATSGLGYIFNGWTGDSDSDEPSIDLLMADDKIVTARFIQDLSDDDNDGLTAYQELAIYGSNPNNPDTDGDNIKDGDEAGTIFDPAVDDTPTLQLLASNPEFFLGLVLSSNAVVPEILIERNETNDFTISIQIEKTEDLTNWEALDLTDAVIDGNKITITIPATGAVDFLRSKIAK